jgi:hypothetical protein
MIRRRPNGAWRRVNVSRTARIISGCMWTVDMGIVCANVKKRSARNGMILIDCPVVWVVVGREEVVRHFLRNNVVCHKFMPIREQEVVHQWQLVMVNLGRTVKGNLSFKTYFGMVFKPPFIFLLLGLINEIVTSTVIRNQQVIENEITEKEIVIEIAETVKKDGKS